MIALYITVTILTFVGGAAGAFVCYMDDDPENMTFSSRVALAAPLWPAILGYYLYKLARVLVLSALGKYEEN